MKELQRLEIAATKPLLLRIPIYLRVSGPGWLQGAMTQDHALKAAELSMRAQQLADH